MEPIRKPDFQKEAIINMLNLLGQTSGFVSELSADIAALKTVVSAFGPDAKKLLDEQLVLERNRIQPHVEKQKMLLEALRVGISQMPSQA